MSHYRGVIPSIPEGVRRVDVAQAHALWRAGAIFIDVNPAPGALRDVETGRWSLAEPHASIPGAHWFAESGRGELDPGIEQAMLLACAVWLPGTPIARLSCSARPIAG
ncbi:hypothetical protein [Sphingomonas sp. Ant H11]|uniref:hypothetical protein n=1 Tax=Sphingomonas sp. Ant H11 TaxID=1564113 RepID=UPI000AA6766A|nr:hypothetical protein [Sphingomonas sp. Ant H11]